VSIFFFLKHRPSRRQRIAPKELWESSEWGFLVPWAGTMYYLFTARVGGELIAGTYICVRVNYVHNLLV